MAKKLLTSYTFAPGAANAGTLVVSGTYELEQFLLITNVSAGATIYQFNKPSKGGTVASAAGKTTLTLEADTSAMSAGDRLQLFVDDALPGQVTLTNASVEISNDVGNPVPVSGTVTATGPLTDTQLRASAVSVAPAVQLGMGVATATTQLVTLATNGAAVTALTSIDNKTPALDTGAVPVLVKNGQLEIQNDTGNPIPVGTAAQLNVTGSASANNTDLINTACDAYRSIAVQITGTFVGTLSFQVSNDNTNWAAVAAKTAGDTAGSLTNSVTTPQLAIATLNGYQYFRLRFTSYTSGTATANAYLSRDCIPLAQVQIASTNTVVASTATSATVLYTVNSAATTNAASVKASGANVYGLSIMNTSAATRYVRLYNLATAPTVGTSVPIMVVAVPASSSKEIQYVPAVRFGTGLAVAITGGAAATDSTAVAAGDVQLLVSYA